MVLSRVLLAVLLWDETPKEVKECYFNHICIEKVHTAGSYTNQFLN